MNNKKRVKNVKRITGLAILLMAGFVARGQVNYLAAFDEDLLHYGIQIGYTQSKFDFHYTYDDAVTPNEQGTRSYYTPGFHIAVIGDLRLTRFMNLRFLPGLTLINRTLRYTWSDDYLGTHPGMDAYRNVESVYGELPFDLKFRSMRYKNFRPYLTVGSSYGFDFASLRNNRNSQNQSIVRLNTSDLRYTAGLGFDFYLRYVKFAIELKMTFGVMDLKIDNDDFYSQSIDGLNTRTFMLGFTFEG